jgi:hypothetical protein
VSSRLENIDEVLRYARLSGYLYIRSRWTQLPGEPPILDDADVDDWLPRFVVLQGQCVYYYLKSTGKYFVMEYVMCWSLNHTLISGGSRI